MDIAPVPRPRPQPEEPLNQQFWELCQTGWLHIQRCTGCGAWRHLPRYQCAHCGSMQWEWAISTGKGSLFSWTIVHQPMHPGFASETPYAAVVIELEEGVRMVSMLRGLPLDALRLGLPLELGFERQEDGFLLPVCRPVDTP
ncbi:MAG: OB-fold domain-containing protein [Pseudomonadota bacterium]|nr:OB-fold domain-containing protein [Pseudomonadota bacterium]